MDWKDFEKLKIITQEELEKFRNEDYPKMIKRLIKREELKNKTNENEQEN